MSSQIRVRFAPSPTGLFHVGSARTALFNWLYARNTGGVFVLRIEDTDHERNTPEALEALIKGMRWLGLDWDEGPEAGGDYGPYFQSERTSIYDEYIEKLKASGRTYEKDGALYFKLEGERYTEFDSHLGREVEKVKSAPQVIDDMIRGRVERAEERDFVIVRSSGEPVFHLVNVVDDLTMGITHVIRGEDHLSNTSKHCELFRALGEEPPKFAHIPLILKYSGKGKMSKRDEGALVEQYIEQHYVPDAVRNYLGLLGWSPKNDQEIFTGDEMIREFSFAGVSQSNAKFDHDKLTHMNAEYLRAMPAEQFVEMAKPLFSKDGDALKDLSYFSDVIRLVQPKANRLTEVEGLVGYFFGNEYPTDAKVADRLAKKGDPKEKASAVLDVFEESEDWNAEELDSTCEALATKSGGKKFDYFPVLRFAVSGVGGGPDLMPMLEVMGKKRVTNRLKAFIES
ncbi:MAG: glutamate--tRNA ligase family protein [Verrucomicrobiota bacterium]